MYNVSEEYKAATVSPSRESKVEGEIILGENQTISFDSSDILAGSLSIDNSAVNGQELNLGTVYSGRLQATLKLNIDRYQLYNKKISIVYFLKISSGWEAVPIGVYYISEAQRQGDYISIVAYDAMLNFNKNISYATTTTGKPYTLIAKCCENCGVDMEQDEETIDSMCAFEIVEDQQEIIRYGLPTDQSITTYRDLLSDIAVVMGGFFVIGRTGALRFQKFGEDTGLVITDEIRKSAEIYDYQCIYSGVSAILNKEPYLVGTEDNIVIQLGEVNLLKNGLLPVKQLTIQHIYDQIAELTYTPGSITWMGDPAIDLGDMFTVDGYNTDVDGNAICVTSFSWTFHGNQKFQAVGKNIKMISAQKANEQKMQDIASIAKNESVQKFVTFYNSEAFSVGATPYRIARLIAPVSEQTSLLATGQIIINITTPGTIKLTYVLNGEEKPYSPMQICPVAGYYMINILYVLKDIIESDQNIFEVLIESADGEGTVEVEQCILNLSGSGLVDAREWDGTLTISDNIWAIYLGTINPHIMYRDTVEYRFINPNNITATDTFNKIHFAMNLPTLQDLLETSMKSKMDNEINETYNPVRFQFGLLNLADTTDIIIENAE